jgi:hypothetical protein
LAEPLRDLPAGQWRATTSEINVTDEQNHGKRHGTEIMKGIEREHLVKMISPESGLSPETMEEKARGIDEIKMENRHRDDRKDDPLGYYSHPI